MLNYFSLSSMYSSELIKQTLKIDYLPSAYLLAKHHFPDLSPIQGFFPFYFRNTSVNRVVKAC